VTDFRYYVWGARSQLRFSIEVLDANEQKLYFGDAFGAANHTTGVIPTVRIGRIASAMLTPRFCGATADHAQTGALRQAPVDC